MNWVSSLQNGAAIGLDAVHSDIVDRAFKGEL
jgi:hypothetical protein